MNWSVTTILALTLLLQLPAPNLRAQEKPLTNAQFSELYAKLSVVTAKEGVKHLGWKDGQDPKLQHDPGRGDTKYENHKEAAADPKRRVEMVASIATRFREFSKLKDEDFADVYAQLSVILAEYGRKQMGWKDGQDPQYPYDPGRGDSSYKNHYDFAKRPGNRLLAAQDVAIRMLRLTPEAK